MEIALDPNMNKTGDCWHICVEGMKNIGSMLYGWRAEGHGGAKAICTLSAVLSPGIDLPH
jgi:hypothetical protein